MDPRPDRRRRPRRGRRCLARRHDAGQGVGAWRTLLPAIAADVAVQPLLTPAELHADRRPTLVVCGDRDPFVPVDHAWGLQRQLPDGRLFVVPDCGHEVMVRRPAPVQRGAGRLLPGDRGGGRPGRARLERRADGRPRRPRPTTSTRRPRL